MPLTVAISVLSLILVGLGGYVRGTGAGLSCPDWPLCYGKAVPPDFGNGVLQEVVHRYLASAVSLLTVIFSLVAYRSRKLQPRIWNTAIFALVILLCQVILGGLTVLLKLNPFIVTSHLALGTVFLQLFVFLSLELSRRERAPSVLGNSRREAGLLLGLTLLQILLGGFVGSSGASLSCPDLPYCFGALLPAEATHQQEIHMLHRFLGVTIFLAVSLAAIRERASGQGAAASWLSFAWVIVTIQFLLGVLNVYSRVHVHVAVSHLIFAQLLLLSLIQVWRLKAGFPVFGREASARVRAPLRAPEYGGVLR